MRRNFSFGPMPPFRNRGVRRRGLSFWPLRPPSWSCIWFCLGARRRRCIPYGPRGVRAPPLRPLPPVGGIGNFAFRSVNPPTVPGIQNQRRIPKGEKQGETPRAEVPTNVEIGTGPRDESAHDVNVASPLTKADDTRGDFSAPPQGRPWRFFASARWI